MVLGNTRRPDCNIKVPASYYLRLGKLTYPYYTIYLLHI
jgi:hypothetical protein